MSRMIFVNLPVKQLAASKEFYEALGFRNNKQFSDENSAAMVWSETIVVMLLTHAKWSGFTNRAIPASTASEVMLGLSFDDRKAVDEISGMAAEHGGAADVNPKQDLGFLYSRSFLDPDGHVWEAIWMDPSAVSSAD